MKIKMGGKIFLLVLVCAGVFFLVKHYQSTHPTNVIVITDSATLKPAPDSQEAVTGKPDTNTTPSAQNGDVKAPAKITPETAHPEHVVHHTAPKPKKKDGERENVKLDNY